MSDRGETREQSSDPPRTEYGYLAVGAAALTAAIACCVIDQLTEMDLSRGMYSILVGLFVVGGVGWIVRSGDTKRRKELSKARVKLRAGQVDVCDRLAELTSRIEELTEQVAQQRVVHLPTTPKPYQGTRYLSAAVGGQGDTVPTQPGIGLDAETIAAARSLARKMMDSPD